MPIVSIVFGSESDRAIMKEAENYLTSKGILFESKALSAHRDTKPLLSYAKELEKNGIKIIIAGAGLSAQLPGLIAANTNLPVIGVPIKAENSFDGIEAVLSIMQMPKGVPVATVGLNGAKNAAILVERILNIFNKNN